MVVAQPPLKPPKNASTWLLVPSCSVETSPRLCGARSHVFRRGLGQPDCGPSAGGTFNKNVSPFFSPYERMTKPWALSGGHQMTNPFCSDQWALSTSPGCFNRSPPLPALWTASRQPPKRVELADVGWSKKVTELCASRNDPIPTRASQNGPIPRKV